MLAKLFVSMGIMLALAVPTFAQTATPTPAPPQLLITATVPRSEMYQALATANANIQQMPQQIRDANGQRLVNTDNAQFVFGYAKWLFSTNTAYELLGQTFAPFGINLFLLLTITIILTSIYFLVWFVILILKAITWIVNQILKIIPFW